MGQLCYSYTMISVHTNYMKHMIHDLSFIPQGWVSDQEALGTARLIPCGVYGFLLATQRPNISMLPCDYEDALYIGQSSGEPYFDKKSKNGKGQMKLTMVCRILAHRNQISRVRRGISKDTKYIELVERMDANPELKLWICLISPDVNTKDLEGTRAMCYAIEACGILDYTLRWGAAPIMNKAQCQKNSRRKPGSISAKHISNISTLPF